jgi:hypothetical protein
MPPSNRIRRQKSKLDFGSFGRKARRATSPRWAPTPYRPARNDAWKKAARLLGMAAVFPVLEEERLSAIGHQGGACDPQAIFNPSWEHSNSSGHWKLSRISTYRKDTNFACHGAASLDDRRRITSALARSLQPERLTASRRSDGGRRD